MAQYPHSSLLRNGAISTQQSTTKWRNIHTVVYYNRYSILHDFLLDNKSLGYNSRLGDQVLRENSIYIYVYVVFTSILNRLSIMKEYRLAELYEKSHSDTINQVYVARDQRYEKGRIVLRTYP